MRLVLLLALVPIVTATTAPGAPVTVAVSGIPASKGKVHVDICPEARFTRPGCPWSAEAPAASGTTIVTVQGVPPGRYAAQAFHDANGNGKADRNFMGLPTELVGFSNDARPRMAPPRFADAAFAHDATPQRIAFAVRKVP